ncbi:hypothetical protein D3C76_1399780 [compost metagenome]
MPETIERFWFTVDDDELSQAKQHNGQRGPGQHNPYRVIAINAAHQQYRNADYRRTGHAKPHSAKDIRHIKQRDRQDDRQRGTGIHTEQAGICQRITGERLHDDASRAKCRSNHHRQ